MLFNDGERLSLANLAQMLEEPKANNYFHKFVLVFRSELSTLEMKFFAVLVCQEPVLDGSVNSN